MKSTRVVFYVGALCLLFCIPTTLTAQKRNKHLTITLIDTDGNKHNFGDEIERLEFIYGQDGNFAMLHLIERVNKTPFGIVHHWFNMQRIISINYRAHSVIGQGRIHFEWVPVRAHPGPQKH